MRQEIGAAKSSRELSPCLIEPSEGLIRIASPCAHPSNFTY